MNWEKDVITSKYKTMNRLHIRLETEWQWRICSLTMLMYCRSRKNNTSFPKTANVTYTPVFSGQLLCVSLWLFNDNFIGLQKLSEFNTFVIFLAFLKP